MAVLFGMWNFDGAAIDPGACDRVEPLLATQGPDSTGYYKSREISIAYRAFHTTPESRAEIQPHITQSGIAITWDGRLDNRCDLLDALKIRESGVPDVKIVGAAYEQWGIDCLGRLVGDWALSIWNPAEKTVILCKDYVGSRRLFYSIENDRLVWSTLLEPLVHLSKTSLDVDLEYFAGWLAFGPAATRTPYTAIKSVPPCHYVLIRRNKVVISEYWNFDPNKHLYYRKDEDYEEHFRAVFLQAVRRRLRSNAPVLAELSGGMDSSSIVCTADKLAADGRYSDPPLNTISYYSEMEPNWDERPYFSLVEAGRGRIGHHIDVTAQKIYDFASCDVASVYGPSAPSSQSANRLLDCLQMEGSRVLLSGIGGDEVLGGVPTPIPELGDLAMRLKLRQLARQLTAWSLTKRKPWLQLLGEVLREFLPACDRASKHIPAWLTADFTKSYRVALTGYQSRLRAVGPLATFQINIATLEALRRQMSLFSIPLGSPYEPRYPYLDRDLVEFIYAVPREQILRPGQRRSLMRRALRGIVPDPIIDRKRKGFVSYAPFATLRDRWGDFLCLSQRMRSEALGIIDVPRFRELAKQAWQNADVSVSILLRACVMEQWLRGFAGLEYSHLGISGENPATTKKIPDLTTLVREEFS